MTISRIARRPMIRRKAEVEPRAGDLDRWVPSRDSRQATTFHFPSKRCGSLCCLGSCLFVAEMPP